MRKFKTPKLPGICIKTWSYEIHEVDSIRKTLKFPANVERGILMNKGKENNLKSVLPDICHCLIEISCSPKVEIPKSVLRLITITNRCNTNYFWYFISLLVFILTFSE